MNEMAEPLVVGAVSVFVFRGDRLLALRRSTRSDAAPGAWDAVSGRIQDREHPHDAAIRETREETGLAVTPDETPIVAYSARRAAAPMLVVAYRAESTGGDVTISAEHEEWAWMTVEEFGRACTFPLLVDAARRAAARGDCALASAPASIATKPARSPHVIAWEFRVKPGREAEFEAAYGPEGDWVRLFRRAPGFLGTDLLRAEEPGRYVTLDRWAGCADFEAFRERHREAYDALDRRTGALTVREERLGGFVPLSAGSNRVPEE
jgi:8-oxo-dGTP pyrophosphatase MutT (NUDIX family)/heme-degrading monooxygenase HmoA